MNRFRPWLAGGLLLAAAALLLRQFPLIDFEKREARGDRTEALRALAAHVAAQNDPGGCVVVLSNPYAEAAGGSILAFEKAGIEGLRKGFPPGTRIEIVHPDIRPEFRDDPGRAPIPDTTTPLSYLMEAGSLERIAVQHPDCSLWVSLVGLPAGIGSLGLWRGEGGVRFALLEPDLRFLGAPGKAAEAFRSGRIAAAVFSRQGKTLIVDAGNVEKTLVEQPQLLGFKRSRR